MESKLTSRDIAAAYYRLAEMASEAGQLEEGSAELERMDAEALELFETLGEEAPEKLESLRAVSVRLDGEAKLLRAESKRLTGIARRLEREGGFGVTVFRSSRHNARRACLPSSRPRAAPSGCQLTRGSSGRITSQPGRSSATRRPRSSLTGRRRRKPSKLERLTRTSRSKRVRCSIGDRRQKRTHGV